VCVITYGSFDLLHRGHIRLLQRLRKIADHLVVCVSTDEFHIEVKKKEGLVNDELMRANCVQELELADEVFFERSWAQRYSDIVALQNKGYEVVFAVGTDWVGKFDDLEEVGATVIYVPRTKDISSTMLREKLK